MVYKPSEIESMLLNKLKMVQENADHRWFVLKTDGIPPIRTKISHSKKDVRDHLQSRIQKQLRIRKKFFTELMDCTKELSDYEEQLRTAPYPPFDHLIV